MMNTHDLSETEFLDICPSRFLLPPPSLQTLKSNVGKPHVKIDDGGGGAEIEREREGERKEEGEREKREKNRATKDKERERDR